jgi:peptidoglycan/LPS O-acetylase OafA/YrhL
MTEDRPHLNIIGSRFLELDALRGLAAAMVVLFHFTINANGAILGWEFSYGVTGVDIFFIISGFVIFLTISRVKKWPDFVVSRFARLYPAFWCCMFLTAIATAIFEPDMLTFSRVLANMTMAPIYFGIENLDQSYWTLLVELAFYTWILVLFVTTRLHNIVSAGFLFLIFIILFHRFSPHYPGLHEYIARKVELLNHFPLFFSGILFYLIRTRKDVFRNTLLIIFSFLTACFLHYQGGRSQYHVSPMEHYVILAFYHIVFALTIFGRMSFLNRAPLLFLGKISYSLYLIHQYIGIRLLAVLTDDLGLNIYPSLLVVIAFCIGLAYAVNQIVEVPANRLIRNWYKHRTQKNAHAESTGIAVQ